MPFRQKTFLLDNKPTFCIKLRTMKMQPTMAIVYEPYRVLISLLHPPSQYPPSQYPPFMYPSAPQLAAPWYSTPIQVSQPATLHEQGTVYTSLLQPPAPYYTAVNSSEQQLYRVCNHQPFIMPTHQLAQPSTRQAQLAVVLMGT